jgi:hypothetical protein
MDRSVVEVKWSRWRPTKDFIEMVVDQGILVLMVGHPNFVVLKPPNVVFCIANELT